MAEVRSQAQGFHKVDTYLHVYLQEDEVDGCLDSRIPGLRPIHVFAHYWGESASEIQRRFSRGHECNRYNLISKA